MNHINEHHDHQPLDHVVQYVRCYTVPDTERIERCKASRHPTWTKTKAAHAGAREPRSPGQQARSQLAAAQHRLSTEGRAIKEFGAPYEGWCLVFDTETTTDTAQRLRFGFYEIHGLNRDERIRLYRQKRLTRAALDRLHTAGVFYDPQALSPGEVALIQRHAKEHGLACLTRAEFVRLFYRWTVRHQTLCIGHNLPFDLSRLATAWTEAAGDFRGGFTLKLCDCPHGFSCFDHPPIRVKHLGKHKARIAFQRVKPLAKRGQDKPGQQQHVEGAHGKPFYAKRPIEGRFLDTATLGRALLGPGDSSLAGLGRRFNVHARKTSADEHGAALTDAYLDYARQDVAATWALYQAERELYRRHGVNKPMWKIYSEASLGKAYLQELGVPPFLQAHPEVPPEVHGYGMMAYYGGRSEVRIRLQPTEVEYCDFKSQYTTMNAVMGLQDLLLARTVTLRDATADVQAMLATLTLDQLQSPAFWRRLRVLVKIRPESDLLPVRAEYGPEGRNIADVYVTGPPTWYALADVLASVTRTKKVPEVLEAVELVPRAERVETQPWRLFGDARYIIDLAQQDFFTEVITDVCDEG